jgi:eukaryotic-like serine/threonine-protein kinase
MTAPVIAGRYVLHKPLALGGMAQLHLGVMRGAVGFARIVAIKRLLGHLATDKNSVAMFVDEARLASRIRHPNVIPTLDVVAETNELFVIMEYVHGESLAKLIPAALQAKKDIPLGIALDIAIGMLEGLHAAHEAKDERGTKLNIVHRDVSPQNVLVGIDGVTRVLDFGIAQAESQVYESNHGSLKGKLAYMAPEQVLGEAVDRRADIWSASVVLWELLTRRRLFVAEHAPSYMDLILFREITPPSAHARGSPELDAIVMKGLERSIEKRWQTALEMACALEEAGRRANAREVGAWVEDGARETLAKRRALIEEIENGPLGNSGASLRKQVAALAEANVATDVTAVLPRGKAAGAEPGPVVVLPDKPEKPDADTLAA